MKIEDLKSRTLKEFYNSLRIGTVTIEASAYTALASSDTEDQLIIALFKSLDSLEERIREAVSMVSTGAREIGVKVGRTLRARIQSIRIYRIIDESPDLSYLETTAAYHYGKNGANWDHVSEEGKKKVIEEYGSIWDACIAYAIQDKKRLEAYKRGEWHMLGISVKATILIPAETAPESFRIQDIASSGLWGIESDSKEEYLKQVEDEQLEELKGYLRTLNIEDIDKVTVQREG